MKRRIFAILSVLALAFCVVTVALWVQSYDTDRLVRVTPRWLVWNSQDPQAIRYVCLAENGSLWMVRGPAEELRHIGEIDERSVVPGVRYLISNYNRNTQMVWISFWYPLIAGLATATYFSHRWWIISRRIRRGRGYCTHCGYDLRATPGRCPECGIAPAGK